MKIQPIKPELRNLIEDFLTFPSYQFIFREFAKAVGYHGDDVQKIRNCLFVPNEVGELFFSVSGMYDLFLEYQLINQLIDKEPYKSLLKEYPESIQNIAIIAKKAADGLDLDEQDLVLIFDTDKYDEARRKVGAGKVIESKEKLN